MKMNLSGFEIVLLQVLFSRRNLNFWLQTSVYMHVYIQWLQLLASQNKSIRDSLELDTSTRHTNKWPKVMYLQWCSGHANKKLVEQVALQQRFTTTQKGTGPKSGYSCDSDWYKIIHIHNHIIVFTKKQNWQFLEKFQTPNVHVN